MLVAASLTATVTRYVAMRTWVFTHRNAAPSAPSECWTDERDRCCPRRGCAASPGSRARSSACSRSPPCSCLWNLTVSGYSNEYYAAAARAGSESWKAWFFGSIDPGSFITVDKPPLSLWLMGLSARVLGFSSFAILLPQALCTIAAVGTAVRHRPARRRPGRRARRRGRAGAHADHDRDRARQQPRRAARPAARALRLPDRAGDRVRPRQVALLGGRDRRPRLHDQDAAGLDGRARARRSPTCVAGAAAAARRASASWSSPAP